MLEVKDCNGQIHNKKFKSLAESVGLIVEKSKKYGFGHTACSEQLKSIISNEIKPDSSSFKYFRYDFSSGVTKKEKTIFTYQCPQCGEKIRAKKDKNILCGKCNCGFEIKE
jgi:ribosomal protein S27AE